MTTTLSTNIGKVYLAPHETDQKIQNSVTRQLIENVQNVVPVVNTLVTSGSTGQTFSGISTIPTLNWYVLATGSDSNNGQSNTAGGAFLTIQKAINTVYSYDLNGQAATINVGAGTFAAFELDRKSVV